MPTQYERMLLQMLKGSEDEADEEARKRREMEIAQSGSTTANVLNLINTLGREGVGAYRQAKAEKELKTERQKDLDLVNRREARETALGLIRAGILPDEGTLRAAGLPATIQLPEKSGQQRKSEKVKLDNGNWGLINPYTGEVTDTETPYPKSATSGRGGAPSKEPTPDQKKGELDLLIEKYANGKGRNERNRQNMAVSEALAAGLITAKQTQMFRQILIKRGVVNAR